MASLESRAFTVFLKLIRKKSFLKKQFDYGKFDFYQCPKPPTDLGKVCRVEKRMANNRNVYTLHPRKQDTNKHILYLHGGAYVQNFVRQHWTFLGLLVESLHCSITAPDYPLAPAHTYKDAFAMVEPLYHELVKKVQASRVILMGDSAGGGFALALSQLIASKGYPEPAKLILLSPWLDITLKNPAIRAIDPLDPFLGIDGLQKAGMSYAGDTNPDCFLLSPINGPAEGLPEIFLFSGARDILVADARKWKDMMQEKGIRIHYYEYDEMIHVWMLLNFPESKKARDQIIAIIGDTKSAPLFSTPL